MLSHLVYALSRSSLVLAGVRPMIHPTDAELTESPSQLNSMPAMSPANSASVTA